MKRLIFVALLAVLAVASAPVDAQIGIPAGTTGGGAPTGAAGGDLSGTYPNPSVGKIGGVAPGTGVVPAIGNTLNGAGGLLGVGATAGGDLSGTYPNPGVAKVGGVTPATGSLLPRAHVFATPANPTGTSSTASDIMMGIGVSITPTSTGTILFMVSGQQFQSTANDGCLIHIHYGTGTAPINGAAAAGTGVGNAVSTDHMVASQSVSFAVQGNVPGFVLGTPIWMDVALQAITGGTCSLFNLNVTALEQ